MPELPEVECARLSLLPKLKGKKIIDVSINLDKIIKQQSSQIFVNRIKDLEILDIKRRGKYLLFLMSENYTLIVHLGMTGACFAVKKIDDINEKFKKHVHAVLSLNDGSIMAYCDIRRFGGLRIFNEDEMNSPLTSSITKMGPEPFEDNADKTFLNNVRKRMYKNVKQEDGTRLRVGITIKEAILDQSNVAGVGNIYACESLAYAGIIPNKTVDKLSDEQIITVFELARDLMRFSISVGGSSVSDYVDGEGKMGKMQNYLVVYRKDRCVLCNSKTIKSVVGGRGTTHCPKCQI